MAVRVSNIGELQPGNLFEDCSFHPCLCVEVEGQFVYGVSLIDGKYPRSCNILHCGLRKLSLVEVLRWKVYGPPDVELDQAQRWW